MKKNRYFFSMIILFITACSAIESPPKESSVIENPTMRPTSLTPTDTPTTKPNTSSTPRPTVDLNLVLTPIITVDYEVNYIILKTSDNVQITAKKYGEGDLAVILAHQGTIGANQRDWDPFARMIAQRGYTAVTLDFRGYGHSKGDPTAKYYLIRDMRAVIDYLLDLGYDRFVCIGASMGGTTCLRTAVEYDLEGLVVIGSLYTSGEPTNITEEQLAGLTIPKLFITTENDGYEVPEAIKSMYNVSQEPKLLRVFPGEAHGTKMFDQLYGEEFTAELLAFLESMR